MAGGATAGREEEQGREQPGGQRISVQQAADGSTLATAKWSVVALPSSVRADTACTLGDTASAAGDGPGGQNSAGTAVKPKPTESESRLVFAGLGA